MRELTSKNSILLFVDCGKDELASVRSMLSGKELSFYEAPNLREAVDELCDYTVAAAPELVVVPVTKAHDADADAARRMYGTVSNGPAPVVILYSPRSDAANVVCSLDQLGRKIENHFPYRGSRAAQAVN